MASKELKLKTSCGCGDVVVPVCVYLFSWYAVYGTVTDALLCLDIQVYIKAPRGKLANRMQTSAWIYFPSLSTRSTWILSWSGVNIRVGRDYDY